MILVYFKACFMSISDKYNYYIIHNLNIDKNKYEKQL